jgi:hypothetical protein
MTARKWAVRDDGYRHWWFGRVYFGYMRHDPEMMRLVWRESYLGDKFRSVTLGRHTFAIGWIEN